MNTSVRHGGIYVKAVIPKGAAESNGRIHKGRLFVCMGITYRIITSTNKEVIGKLIQMFKLFII